MKPDKLKEEVVSLFNKRDKELVEFANATRNKYISDIANIEMMRRMKFAIKEFNKNSTKQTSKMIKLTKWIIGLTIAMGVLALIQIIILIKPTF
ncbi:MAG: hypothetical protein KKH88_01615 [Nanoarchaeota archaeon]|nr:hypothetical protein [Nanoarchaeota archaeon]